MMTTAQKRKILEKIVMLEHDIDTLKQVRIQLATSEYVSASLASGGGSKSYTRMDLDKVTSAINQLTAELKSLRALLKDRAPASPNQIYTVYI